jgi:nucleoside-diphosphate-sugar epimerase
MCNVLVTGSSGFLGSQIVEAALAKNFSVIGLDINPPSKAHGENFSFFRLDISKIEDKTFSKIDFVIHAASILPYGNSAELFEKNNVATTVAVSRFANANKAFLVEIGSSSVYGRPITLPVTKSTPLSPMDAYARSKMQAELEVGKILGSDSYAVIRPRTILGHGRAGIFDIFFGLINRGLPIPLPNSGKQVIQFVHVRDLASLSLHLGQNRISGIWPGASPDPKPLHSYLKHLSSRFELEVRYIPLNALLFKVLGGFAYRLRISKFTPWHFGAFPYDNYVAEDWIPEGFRYNFTCQKAFNETFQSSKVRKPSKFAILRLGRKV